MLHASLSWNLCLNCVGRELNRSEWHAGVLLRRLSIDRELSSVSHVIVDEIHERGVNEDLLLMALKQVLALRPNLKVILMSATLNADKFSAFYPGSKPVHIPGYTFPVNTHYLEHALKASGLPFPAVAKQVRSEAFLPAALNA